jgi:WD40 repeat protein
VTDTRFDGTVGETVASAPVVRALDRAGTPVPGVTISFEVTSGGSIERATVQTDHDGTAAVGAWTLGRAPGTQTLTARGEGLAEVVFTADAAPGPPARVTAVSGNNQNAPPGTTLSSPLRVRVADRFENPVPQVPVTFAVISGTGTLERGSTVTDSAGIASSGAWTLGPEYGAHLVRAVTGGVEAEVFTAIACDVTCLPWEIAFVRNGQIYMGASLGQARQLVAGGDGHDSEPAWSPDGLRIAFVRHGDIYLMRADSTAVLRIQGYRSPAWSPDGSRLVLAKGDCVYTCTLFLLNLDQAGSVPATLTSMAAEPAWSPDGKQIAFVSLSSDDGYHALHVINADGSGLRVLVPRDDGAIDRPAWSPDGRRIAFAKCRLVSCGIFTVNADAESPSDIRRITNLAEPSADALSPAWSPDGAWIAFVLWTDTPSQTTPSIAYIRADGSGEPIHSFSPGLSPAWRP